mgnify:CR=1 FL=1
MMLNYAAFANFCESDAEHYAGLHAHLSMGYALHLESAEFGMGAHDDPWVVSLYSGCCVLPMQRALFATDPRQPVAQC